MLCQRLGVDWSSPETRRKTLISGGNPFRTSALCVWEHKLFAIAETRKMRGGEVAQIPLIIEGGRQVFTTVSCKERQISQGRNLKAWRAWISVLRGPVGDTCISSHGCGIWHYRRNKFGTTEETLQKEKALGQKQWKLLAVEKLESWLVPYLLLFQ